MFSEKEIIEQIIAFQRQSKRYIIIILEGELPDSIYVGHGIFKIKKFFI